MTDIIAEDTHSEGKGGFAYLSKSGPSATTFNVEGTLPSTCSFSRISSMLDGGVFYLDM